MYGYETRKRPELAAVRVMICESEIQRYADEYPELHRDTILATMIAVGPHRGAVEDELSRVAEAIRFNGAPCATPPSPDALMPWSRVIEFVERNLHRPLVVRDLAQEIGLSPFHFSREFKKHLGATPHAYVVKVRTDKARRLLANSDLSLLRIAKDLGFLTQSHFTHVFKKCTGTTPKVFRSAIRSARAPRDPQQLRPARDAREASVAQGVT